MNALFSQQSLPWSACYCCGVLQPLPPPVQGQERICWRCQASLGSGVIVPQAALAFTVTALFLLALSQFYPILGIEMEGQSHTARIISGVGGLAEYDFPSLGLFVLVLAIVAPALRILTLFWVLGHLRLRDKPAYLTRVFRMSEYLRPWAMLDVLLLGIFVASSKLRDLAHIQIGIGFWALGLVVLALAALDASFDRRAIWDMLCSPPVFKTKPDPGTWASCNICEFLHKNDETHSHCKRCGAPIHYRKPASSHLTLALVAAGFILYIPANLYPILTTVSLGQATPSTIMGGVRQLMDNQDWVLAAILFTASIIIPLLKLSGLTLLLLSIYWQPRLRLLERTRLYRGIRFIGRWSNTDILVAATLTGLVTLGNIASVVPGNGALAFGAVVVLTMLATETFDPRLMWDAAERNQ